MDFRHHNMFSRYTHTHAYMHTHTVYTYTHAYTVIWNIHKYTHAYTHAHTCAHICDTHTYTSFKVSIPWLKHKCSVFHRTGAIFRLNCGKSAALISGQEVQNPSAW